MADNKTNDWLDEVKADAEYNYMRNYRKQKEDEAYRKAKDEKRPLPGTKAANAAEQPAPGTGANYETDDKKGK